MLPGPLTDSLCETLGVFDGPNRGTPLTTTEVAARLDIGRRSCYDRLDRLVDRGHLHTKKVGARGRVWWRPTDDAPAREPAPGDDRQLGWYRTILETVDDGVYLLDGDHTFRLVNSAFATMMGYDREELLGSHASRVFGEKYISIANEKQAELESSEATVATLEEELYPATGPPLFVESRFTLFEFDEAETGRVGTVRDIAARKRRKRELERYERIVETAYDGIYAVDGDGIITMVNEAYTRQTGYDRETLVGMHVDRLVDEETVQQARQCESELATGERDTARFEADVQRADGDTFRGEAAFGLVEAADGGDERVGVVRDITERKRRERAIERQRERLAALDDLNGVVRGITEAVFEQSTREEIERVVCEALAAADSYAFAWLGEVDTREGTVEPHVEAAAADYLDGRPALLDGGSREPAVRAASEPGMCATTVTPDDDDPWAVHARDHAVRTAAAIPVVHDDVRYGVLSVYTDRADAFEGDERGVLAPLGEVVGQAIAAVERRRALTSDELVALEFHVANLADDFELSTVPEGRLSFARSVPASDDTYLAYGTVSASMAAELESLVDRIPHWGSVRLLDGGAASGRRRFELRVADPPVLSEVTALGGYVERATIVDGEYTIRIHLPPGVDVRYVIDAVEGAFPSAQLTTRRQVPGDVDDRMPLHRQLGDHLTDRQRTVLESAYFGGYFEWPRDTTGEELADSLGIASPTLHQHLRKAQGKVLALALADATAE